MRIVMLCLVLSLVVSLAAPALAQPAIPPDGCTRLGFAEMFSEAANLLTTDTSADDPDILAASLNFYLSNIQSRRAACAELQFAGDTAAVVGPFTLPAGTWIQEATFTYFANTHITALDEDCELPLLGTNLLSSMDGESTDQTVIQIPTDCRILVEVNTTKPWSLSFTPVR